MNRKPMDALRLAVVLAAVGAGAGAFPRAAEAQAPPRVSRGTVLPGSMGVPQPEPRITLMQSQRSLGRILSDVFKQTGYKYQVLANLGTSVFSLNVKDMPLTEVLKMLLAQDRSNEPLVFSFTRDGTGTTGTFTIDREYLEVGPSEGENRVSVANARITQVLPKVFEQMKVPYRIEPDVPPVLISLEVRPQDWSTVIPQVIIEANRVEPTLTYSMDGKTWVVHLQKTLPTGTPGMPVRRVKLAVSNAPLRSVLEELFRESAWKYQVADEVRDTNVTYSVSNEPELSALRSILRQAAGTGGQQVTYREGRGILYIEPGPLPGEAKVVVRKDQRGLVTLDVKDLRLRVVVESIAMQAGVKITVPQNIPNLPVSVKIQRLPVEDALQALIDAVRDDIPNLQFRAVNKEYQLLLGVPANN